MVPYSGTNTIFNAHHGHQRRRGLASGAGNMRQIAAGGASLRQIADALNTRGIKTARGGLWYAATVRNIMARDNEIEAKAA